MRNSYMKGKTDFERKLEKVSFENTFYKEKLINMMERKRKHEI